MTIVGPPNVPTRSEQSAAGTEVALYPTQAPRAASAGAPPRSAFAARLGAYVALTKPRIIELLLVTTVPTMFLAARGVPSWRLMLVTVVGGTLAAGGANAFNMVCDRDIDARMSRTRRRPLVTGAVGTAEACWYAAALEVCAFVLLSFEADLLAACLAAGAALFYVVVYTLWLKRSTPENIVIGGVAGAAPVLVAWAAVTGTVSPVAWALFAVVVFWTPPHFWALATRWKDDYAAVGVPMLPSVASARKVGNAVLAYTAVTVATSLAAAALAGLSLGPPYLVAVLAGGSAFLVKAWSLRQAPTARTAMNLFHYSISYLALVFVCVGVGAMVPW